MPRKSSGGAAHRVAPGRATTAPLLLLAATVALPGGQAPHSKDLPSFLFILADDIGYSDFGYSAGSTALTPHIAGWSRQPGSVVFYDFHSGGTHCTPTRASILTGRTPFRDCVFGTKGADGDDMTEMIDNFTFAPKRTFTIGDAARAASPDFISMHFGKWVSQGVSVFSPCTCMWLALQGGVCIYYDGNAGASTSGLSTTTASSTGASAARQ
jgi:hypothetical protein